MIKLTEDEIDTLREGLESERDHAEQLERRRGAEWLLGLMDQFAAGGHLLGAAMTAEQLVEVTRDCFEDELPGAFVSGAVEICGREWIVVVRVLPQFHDSATQLAQTLRHVFSGREDISVGVCVETSEATT